MEKFKPEDQLRESQGEKVVDFLQKTKAFEYFQELRNNPEEAEEIPFEDFRDLLIRLNGIARDIPIAEREPDGDTVYLEGIVDSHLVPKQEDKEGLLKEAFDARLKLKNPEDISYMLPAVVNAVHLFADGNGRTSRVLNILLTPHASSEDFEKKLKDALGKFGRHKSLDVNAGHLNVDIEKVILARHGMEYDKDGMSKLPDDFNRTFSLESARGEKAKRFWEKREKDVSFCFVAAYNYLKSNGLLPKVIATKEDYPEITLEHLKVLSLKKMEEVLSDEDWDKIMDEYFAMKKETVEVLIDSFVGPEKYKTEDGTTFRDYFVKKVQDTHQKNQESN